MVRLILTDTPKRFGNLTIFSINDIVIVQRSNEMIWDSIGSKIEVNAGNTCIECSFWGNSYHIWN